MPEKLETEVKRSFTLHVYVHGNIHNGIFHSVHFIIRHMCLCIDFLQLCTLVSAWLIIIPLFPLKVTKSVHIMSLQLVFPQCMLLFFDLEIRIVCMSIFFFVLLNICFVHSRRLMFTLENQTNEMKWMENQMVASISIFFFVCMCVKRINQLGILMMFSGKKFQKKMT